MISDDLSDQEEGGIGVLTHDEVVWGYRYILGRDPESDAIVSASAAAMKDVQAFRSALLQSKEFARLYTPFQQSCWVAAPVFGGARLMWIDLSDRLISLGCLQDAYEPAETRFVRGILTANDIFVDVGANIGWYAFLASTIIGDGGHIHAFEPRRPIVDYLQRTVTLNGLDKLITVQPIGLSNEKKSEILMWEAISGNGGGASFARDDASADMVCQTIEVRSLDSLDLGHVDVIKIDVEGAEPLVIEGATTTIERDRPIILTEVLPSQLKRVSGRSPQQYFEFFLSRNYRGFIVDSFRCGESVVGYPDPWDKPLANIAFVPEERSLCGSVFGA
jgi:FkbM family methyltransferase